MGESGVRGYLCGQTRPASDTIPLQQALDEANTDFHQQPASIACSDQGAKSPGIGGK